jgi:hypothetical protein
MHVIVFNMFENTALRKTLDVKEPVEKCIKWSFLACGVCFSLYTRELV